MRCKLAQKKFYFFIVVTVSFLLFLLLSNFMQERFIDQNDFGVLKRFFNRSKMHNTSAALCVWFTTFKDAANRRQIHINTLHNWAKFIPLMQPVLFSSNSTLQFDSIARQLGWHVYQIPRANNHGTPYISDMLDVIMNNDTYDSTFYGFANGDILFDTSLSETLKSLASRRDSLPRAPIMITGQRTNYKMSNNWTEPIVDFYYIEQLRTRGKLFWANAEDYFLFTKDFPRYLFKDLVIGRPAYDNYLVVMSLKLNVSVVDATKTLTALHQQSSRESEVAGHNNKDSGHNYKVIGSFSYKKGHTYDAQYETVFNLNLMQIDIQTRSYKNITKNLA